MTEHNLSELFNLSHYEMIIGGGGVQLNEMSMSIFSGIVLIMNRNQIRRHIVFDFDKKIYYTHVDKLK